MRLKLRQNLSEYKVILLDMDGTLYYQFPLRICMAFTLLGYYVLRPTKIKELLILRAFRRLRESDRLTDCENFEQKQYEILSTRFKVSHEQVENIIYRWMQEKPLKYVRIFRDKKLLRQMQRLRNSGIKLVLYSDYPVEKKLQVLYPFGVDYSFCASDAEINCLKPDSKGIRKIIEILNEPVGNMVFIGDRYEKDGQCAENVGMDYIILGKNPIMRYTFRPKARPAQRLYIQSG
jgi:HAD superfamily hydrolase (TIGR01549 family)